MFEGGCLTGRVDSRKDEGGCALREVEGGLDFEGEASILVYWSDIGFSSGGTEPHLNSYGLIINWPSIYIYYKKNVNVRLIFKRSFSIKISLFSSQIIIFIGNNLLK